MMRRHFSFYTSGHFSQLIFARRPVSYGLVHFVPGHDPCSEDDVDSIARFISPPNSVSRRRRLLVITGAGVSTESGIPDYRSAGVGMYARHAGTQHGQSGQPSRSWAPITYQEFVASPAARQRYWARNYTAWPRFSSREPNPTHTMLEWMCREDIGLVEHVVTQNVDALHSKATGSCDATYNVATPPRHITELHGCAHRVHCMQCGAVTSRHHLQEQMWHDNQQWHNSVLQSSAADVAPDGDVQLSDKVVQSFLSPHCQQCGERSDAVIKPQVVFFGDNVSCEVVRRVYERVENCDAVLCVGTSLHVYSAYRFVLAASKLGKPIGIVNIGQTRADSLATLRLWGRCGEIFDKLQNYF